ncbi:MAG: TIGR03915 family putative DNA repair protein [Eggerthellaceae bacterium]|nr:TIGR03915 family putative DNA repair protein [Eggerthellaceae bacterium]
MDQQKARACGRCRKRPNCAGASGRGPCPKQRGRAISDITHPAVEPLFKIARSVDQECEHMRQFIRFEHLGGGNPSAQLALSTPAASPAHAQRGGSDALPAEKVDMWFARCNPRDSVVPLVMEHFVERFNVQPFVIYDENHHLAGVYDGRTWYLVRTDDPDTQLLGPEALPDAAAEEATVQDAWRRFYRAVAVESRYNPELRRHFMPKRFWKNLTEMQQDTARANTAQAAPAKKQAAEPNRRPARILEPATGIEPATH